jgi:hypothetical protein
VANDDKKIKADSAPKTDAPPKDGSTTNAALPKSGEGGADSSSSYSRGEGQKPMTKAYRENWNAIFGKKKKR